MVKRCPRCVSGCVSEFGAQITRLKAFDALESFSASVLNNKGLYPIVLSVNYASCEDTSMRRESTEITRPVLGGLIVGGVNDPLISGFIQGRGGLKLSDIGSVSQLGLNVAPDDLMLLNKWNPVFQLLLVA